MNEIDQTTTGSKKLAEDCSDAAQVLKAQCEISQSSTERLLHMLYGARQKPKEHSSARGKVFTSPAHRETKVRQAG